ncbi:hypothetical protein CALVIDRAFT_557581 [Calocera viscosa TUFC12733]|uniref:NB-ARC domain-containing protein n=1 Tax=Calocera viscosa (strain TUFC12733) TaxID=1330018 RepID=A0A167I5U7_CALVF|nr:hypothetical protein CALVIDRAFT_557581 [Calocera viscosa TUFC12733]
MPVVPSNTITRQGSAPSDLKSRLKDLKGGLSLVLKKLADVAINSLDIREELTANKPACKALALRVAELTESILVRTTASPEIERMCLQNITRLQECLDDISKFLIEQTHHGLLSGIARMTESDSIKAEIVARDKRLTDVITTLNLDLNMMTTVAVGSLANINAMGSFGSAGASIKAQRVQTTLLISRLPPKPRIFHGREDVVNQAVSVLLKPEPAHIALLGMGGIGKTSTAATILHSEEVKAKYGSNRVFLRCDSITTADGIVSALGAALKVPVSQDDDPRALLLQYLDAIDGSSFLVVDNLESAWDTPDREAVEEFLAELSNIGTLSLVITMRGQQRPVGVDWSSLPPPLKTLDLDASKTIYISNGGKSDEHLEELLLELDGWPLAIVLMAYQGQNRLPSQLLAAYKDERTKLLAMGQAGHLTSVEVSISLSLNSQTVQDVPEALDLLSLLCLLPDGLETKALPAAFPNIPGLQRAERVLEQASLVTRPVENEIKVLSPIRTFVLASHPPGGRYLIDLEDFFCKMTAEVNLLRIHDIGQQEPDGRIKRVMKAFGNMSAVFAHAVSMSLIRADIIDAIFCLGAFALIVGYGDPSVLLKKAIEAGKLHPELRQNTIKIGSILAQHNIMLDRKSEAFEAAEELKALDEDSYMVFAAQLQIDKIERKVENAPDPDEVADQIKESRRHFEAKHDKRGTAVCSLFLALLSIAVEKKAEAIPLLVSARTAYEAIPDDFGVALTLDYQGQCTAALESIPEAGDDLLRQALSIYNRLGILRKAAEVHGLLAESYVKQDKFLEALNERSQEGALYEELGKLVEVRNTERYRARIHAALGHKAESETLLREVGRSFESMGERLRGASCRVELFFYLITAGADQSALLEMDAALRICDELKVEQGVAVCKYFKSRAICKHNHLNDLVAPGRSTTFAEESERLLKEALCIFEASDQLDPKVWVLLDHEPATGFCIDAPRAAIKKDLALLWRQLGRHDEETIGLTQQASTLFTKLNNAIQAAKCKVMIGSILVDRGLYGEGIAVLEEAHSMFQTIPFPEGAAGSMELIKLYEARNAPSNKTISGLRKPFPASDKEQSQAYDWFGSNATGSSISKFALT